jgi:hypothetical protein
MKTIGGSRINLLIGKTLKTIGDKSSKLGAKLIERAKPHEVTEWKVFMHSPYYLVINFKTNKGKYDLIYQGNYLERYKLYKENPETFTEEEVYELIKQGKARWFKK